MPLVLKDRVRETSTTTGTGSITLGGALAGFQSFSVIGNANTTYYGIVNAAANEWEIGIGTYTASGTVLSRDTILESSNGGSAVNFSAGTKDVFVTYPAEKAASLDTFPEPPVIGNTTPNAATFTTLTATGQTSLGGAAGAEGLRVNTVASAVNCWLAQGSATGGGVQLRPFGSDTNTAGLISSKGTSQLSLYTNSFAQEQLRVSHTTSAVNYVQVTGAATGGQVQITAQGSDATVPLTLNTKSTAPLRLQSNSFSVLRLNGSSAAANFFDITNANSGVAPTVQMSSTTDSNVPFVVRTLGTGAINLAPGSSGVNISNGGTVTAITRTAGGSGYTSAPSVAISAPTTAGGVQATASASIWLAGITSIANGGTGYSVNDVLTVSGGTFTTAATVTVLTTSGGVVTSVGVNTNGQYSVAPTNPASFTGGTGAGLTVNLLFNFAATGFTITNAGSGYVEQPTVTFSGGGGSGAAAYATVGSATVLKAIGSSLQFQTPAGLQVNISDSGATAANYVQMQGRATGGGPIISAQGSDSASQLIYMTKGSASHVFTTNGSTTTVQAQVSHTASAVNFVQVTGAATGNDPVISTQGSDADRNLRLSAKGSGQVATTSSFLAHISATNYIQLSGGASAVTVSAIGASANVDVTFTPKGAGNVRFGTYTANMALTIQGYVEIKDSGGTIRRLAVIA